MLSACAPLSTPQGDPNNALNPIRLSITQAGADKTSRYVYCDTTSCPVPTPKTLVRSTAANSGKPMPVEPAIAPSPTADRSQAGTHSASTEIAFPFNSSRIAKGDRAKLVSEALAHAGSDVEIIARSDFVGPPNGQKEIVASRAQAMRRIVAHQTHDARITLHHEIAGPDRVPADEQARQRRGTVRFIQPTSDSQKGASK